MSDGEAPTAVADDSPEVAAGRWQAELDRRVEHLGTCTPGKVQEWETHCLVHALGLTRHHLRALIRDLAWRLYLDGRDVR